MELEQRLEASLAQTYHSTGWQLAHGLFTWIVSATSLYETLGFAAVRLISGLCRVQPERKRAKVYSQSLLKEQGIDPVVRICN